MRAWLAVPAAAIALLAPSCSDEGTPEVAAVVEGVEIPSSETEALVDAYLSRQKDPQQREDLPRDRIAVAALNYQVKLTFLEELAEEMGVEVKPTSYFESAAGAVSPEAFAAIGERPEDLARSLRAGRLSKAIATELFPNLTVSENAVRQEYERRVTEVDYTWQATVQVGLFDAQDPAAQVAERVAGGESFESAATALGADQVETLEIDPVAGRLPAKVLDAINALGEGEVSDAINSRQGWFTVFVTRRTETGKPTFEELSPEITRQLVEVEQANEFQKWFDEKFKEADVEVDGHYGEWNADLTAVV
ncbi:MAG: peptidyl-prolyl cis-trans isomerase [Acidimicrobiia bacterium]